MSKLKTFLFSLVAILISLFILELGARFFFAPGTSDYIERRILQQDLSYHKSPGEFRIFLYGESTMHGFHLAPNATFDVWLKLYLEDLIGKEAAEKIKIYNFARLGEESNFIKKSFIETLPYQPDLTLFYTVHNDFIQKENRDRFFHPDEEDAALDNLKSWIRKSHLISEIARLNIRLKIKRHARRDAEKQEPHFLEGKEKPKYKKPDDLIKPFGDQFKAIEQKWQNNVRDIISLHQKKEIPVIFLSTLANYKDYPPKESEHHETLSPETSQEWQLHQDKASVFLAQKNYQEAYMELHESLRYSPYYANTYYLLGKTAEKLTFLTTANDFYKTANDFDYFPKRAPSTVDKFYSQLAEEQLEGVSILFPQKSIEAASPSNIADSTYFLDAIHPNLQGQALITLAICELLDREKLLPVASFQWENFKGYHQYLESLELDNDYFYKLHYNMAKYFGRNYQKKIEHLKQALNFKPDSFNARHMLAWSCWNLDQKEKALDIYRELFKEDPKRLQKSFTILPELQNVLTPE